MIKSLTAHTCEIDDVKLAVSEILGQLKLGENLLKNSLGIITCYSEFIDTGVVAALSDALPFEVIGMTTLGNAVPGAYGETMLALQVITSDELSFVTALTAPLESEDDEPLREAYEAAVENVDDEPALILSFAPLINILSGDFFVDAMDRISGGLPNFGTVCVDHTSDYASAQVIHNGEAYRDRYCFSLVAGDVAPQFCMGTISEERVFLETGVVTGSAGSLLQSINGISIVEFCKSLGLKQAEDGSIEGINAFPLIVDYNDGTRPVVRSMFATTPEGFAVCGGNMPVGATVSVGAFDAKEVLETSKKTLELAAASAKNGMLIFSCVGRYYAQIYNSTAELELINEALGGQTGYMVGYSGGEICPVYDRDGNIKNRAHNDTIVICIF